MEEKRGKGGVVVHSILLPSPYIFYTCVCMCGELCLFILLSGRTGSCKSTTFSTLDASSDIQFLIMARNNDRKSVLHPRL